MFLISLAVPFLTGFFEIYPRILNPKVGVDIWTHLLFLKEYHRRGGIPKEIGRKQGFLIEGEYDYPPVFIWILSKFPFNSVKKYNFIFSPFFDMLHLIFIFFVVYFLTGSIFISVLSQILYSLTPIIILENSTATPRSLGYTLFSIFLMSVFIFTEYNFFFFLLIALIAGSLIFLSHRFTTQAFLFYAVFFSILEQNPIYIFIFIFSLGAALLLSGGFYFKVLKGHFGNLFFWWKNINFRFMHQVGRINRTRKNEDIILKLYQYLMKFPPFVITITNPWTLSIFYFSLFSFPENPIIIKILWWVVFSYFLALATSLIPFARFLGESQRYLEISAFPAAFLSALLLNEVKNTEIGIYFQILYFLAGLSAFITIIVIQKKAIINDKLRTITPDMEKMFVYLKSLKKKPKLVCIPHQITTNIIYHTGCPVFVNASYFNIIKISEIYPFVRKPLREIIRKYKIDLLLLNEDYAEIKDLKIADYEEVKKIGSFVLLRIL